MKLITQLTGTMSEGDFRDPRGALQSLHLEPKPGVHLRVSLGAAGLVYSRGETRVAVPLDALNKLALEHCPELVAVDAESAAKANRSSPIEAARLLTANSKPSKDVKSDTQKP